MGLLVLVAGFMGTLQHFRWFSGPLHTRGKVHRSFDVMHPPQEGDVFLINACVEQTAHDASWGLLWNRGTDCFDPWAYCTWAARGRQGVGMTPGRIAVCCWQRLLASCHLLLPLPPWAAAPISLSPPCILPLPACPFFPSHSPFLSLGRLCEQSYQTVHVPLLCVGSRQRRATALTIGQVQWGNPPQRRLWGPRMSTCWVTSRTRAHNNLQPALSRSGLFVASPPSPMHFRSPLLFGKADVVPIKKYWYPLLGSQTSSHSSFFPPRFCPLGWHVCHACAN